eukprot:SAG25_NODE_647_length_6214_cov_5.107277_5_plen_554_part_00
MLSSVTRRQRAGLVAALLTFVVLVIVNRASMLGRIEEPSVVSPAAVGDFGEGLFGGPFSAHLEAAAASGGPAPAPPLVTSSAQPASSAAAEFFAGTSYSKPAEAAPAPAPPLAPPPPAPGVSVLAPKTSSIKAAGCRPGQAAEGSVISTVANDGGTPDFCAKKCSTYFEDYLFGEPDDDCISFDMTRRDCRLSSKPMSSARSDPGNNKRQVCKMSRERAKAPATITADSTASTATKQPCPSGKIYWPDKGSGPINQEELVRSRSLKVSGIWIHSAFSLVLERIGKNEAYRSLGSASNADERSKAVGKLVRGEWRAPRLTPVELYDAVVTSDGFYSQATCLPSGYVSGGCSTYFMDRVQPLALDRYTPYDGTVIALGQYWGTEVWHFTAEALVGLATVNYRDLFAKEPNARVQITNGGSKVHYDLLALVGVDRRRVIVGDVRAKKLIRPRQGDCGRPAKYQAEWLHKELRAGLLARLPAGQSLPSPDTLVLIVRTRTRQLKNSDAVQTKAQEIAKREGLTLYIHTDQKVCTCAQCVAFCVCGLTAFAAAVTAAS